ncbi:MAG TPA: hypothetical protein VKB17_02535 [Thermoleophilaceae bacterium]|nr:hypothetical protein [Thermoleophilaceae bacterium]
MSGFVKRVAMERMSGGRPGPGRAILTAAAVGAAAAGVTYRLLRR